MGTLGNLLDGTRTHLAANTTLTALLGSTSGVPWIYKGEPSRVIEGTENSAVVISYAGQASSPNIYNTTLMIKLMVSVWVDPARDDDGNPTDINSVAATDKALQIWQIIDADLHDTGGGLQTWGSAVIISSKRLAAIGEIHKVDDGDGLVVGDSAYIIEVG
jgi:hypothetical protein